MFYYKIGYFHIIFNIIVQLVLGIPLEMVHRWWRILLVKVSSYQSNFFSTIQDCKLSTDLSLWSHSWIFSNVNHRPQCLPSW